MSAGVGREGGRGKGRGVVGRVGGKGEGVGRYRRKGMMMMMWGLEREGL